LCLKDSKEAAVRPKLLAPLKHHCIFNPHFSTPQKTRPWMTATIVVHVNSSSVADPTGMRPQTAINEAVSRVRAVKLGQQPLRPGTVAPSSDSNAVVAVNVMR
jgi:hypothetical protein